MSRKPRTKLPTTAEGPTSGLANRIREVRVRLSLTQEEFSERIGVPKRTLCRYEAGNTEPPSYVLGRICKEFDVNAGWILLGIETSQPFFFQQSEQTAAHKAPLLIHDPDDVLGLPASSKLVKITINSALRSEYRLAKRGNLYSVEMPDETMQPTMKRGDVVVTETPLSDLPQSPIDGLYCVNISGEITVRRLRFLKDDAMLIACDSPDGPNFIRSVRSLRKLPFYAPVKLVVRRPTPKSIRKLA